MNWFGGDSKKEEREKAKQQKAAEDLAVRQAQHARNQRIKHLSGAGGPANSNPPPKPQEEQMKPNEIDVEMKEVMDVVMKEELG